MLDSSYYYDPNAISSAPNYTTDKEHTSFTGEEFMAMFLEELKYQDPTAPQDADKILQQTSQLSNLEAIKLQTSTLENLSSNLDKLQSSNYIDYIGKTVTLTNNNEAFTHYESQFSSHLFSLEESSDFVGVSVFDSEGNELTNFVTQASAGINQINWDGNDANGNPVPSGEYYWSIQAFKDDGSILQVQNNDFKVQSLLNKNGNYYLSLDEAGTIQVSVDNIGVIK